MKNAHNSTIIRMLVTWAVIVIITVIAGHTPIITIIASQRSTIWSGEIQRFLQESEGNVLLILDPWATFGALSYWDILAFHSRISLFCLNYDGTHLLLDSFHKISGKARGYPPIWLPVVAQLFLLPGANTLGMITVAALCVYLLFLFLFSYWEIDGGDTHYYHDL